MREQIVWSYHLILEPWERGNTACFINPYNLVLLMELKLDVASLFYNCLKKRALRYQYINILLTLTIYAHVIDTAFYVSLHDSGL